MTRMTMSSVATLVAATLAFSAPPALAGPGKGNGKGPHHAHLAQAGHCPPGLAKKNPPCVPPGQARQGASGPRVGDVLRIGDYVLIRDPARHDLRTSPDWRYYRDGNRAYRIDPETRRVLAVVELIDAFAN